MAEALGAVFTLEPAAQVGLRADPADEVLLARLGEALGAALPTTPGGVVIAGGGERRVLWLGPDEWLVVDDAEPPELLVAALEEAAVGGFASVVDLSSNRVVLGVDEEERDVLATAITIDLHPRAFADRTCAQTLFAKAPVIVERDGDAWRLYVRPSYERYVSDWLIDAFVGASSGSPAPAR